MPRSMTYKPNSVIYFEGDSSNRIYVLKSGKVTLTSHDIETGQEIHNRVETGEFFGVKSALGRYPQEENAVVVSTAEVIVFTVPEFEEFACQNTRVILKMLKVFSTQLRRIHAKVTNMLDQPTMVGPEHGLFQIGEFFHRQGKMKQARYVLERYLEVYPNGPRASRAKELLAGVERNDYLYSGPSHSEPSRADGHGASGEAERPAAASRGEQPGEETPAGRRYYEAVSMFGREEFQAAFKTFREAAAMEDPDFTVPSLVEAGRCLMHLQRHDDAIRHFTSLVQRYPKMEELPRVLYYLGRVYEEKGERERAGGFFKKVQSLASTDEALQKQVAHAIQNL